MRSQLSAAQVANDFLPLGWSDRSAPIIDQMKLQKLLFYAHAWSLALKDKPLFEEDFEAWPWGPVVKDVYVQTKIYGRGEVVSPLSFLQGVDGKFALSQAGIPNSCPDEKAFVAAVWESHKRFSGIQLSNATHAPGEPWTVIKNTYGSLENKPIIPNDLIADVFKRKVSIAK
jgi:uncharacterized phage-associated protein